ncbi:hypothetical protein [Coleofasciculus sp. G2-EDA-02]
MINLKRDNKTHLDLQARSHPKDVHPNDVGAGLGIKSGNPPQTKQRNPP